MGTPLSSREILEREFLTTRAKILEIAASFDRIERADGCDVTDARWSQLLAALEVVLEHDNRAEQVQLLFSRPYDQSWRENFKV